MAGFNQPVNVFLSTFQNLIFETKASISIDLIECILSLGRKELETGYTGCT